MMSLDHSELNKDLSVLFISGRYMYFDSDHIHKEGQRYIYGIVTMNDKYLPVFLFYCHPMTC